MSVPVARPATALSLAEAWSFFFGKTRPFALWRLPAQPDRLLLADTAAGTPCQRLNPADGRPGFAISPFRNDDGTATRLLEADVLLRFSPDGALLSGHGLHYLEALKTEPLQACSSLQGLAFFEEKAENQSFIFQEAVLQARRAIQAGTLEKVVLSRRKAVTLPAGFDVLALFERLCCQYPTAFVSVVWLPDEQACWVGATPEVLVSQDAAGTFRTMALAGTQAATDADGRPIRPGEARWSQKEIEEQALVSRYIINCFKHIRLREFSENGPKTVQAGNLLHLRTDFSVNLTDTDFPDLTGLMLGLLHPTSAVCGMPRQAAAAFIAAHEPTPRQYYSGYLGPVNIGGETHLFVNLRTMQLRGTEGLIYAGAGITEDSDPEKEWLETEMKCRTLLNALSV